MRRNWWKKCFLTREILCTVGALLSVHFKVAIRRIAAGASPTLDATERSGVSVGAAPDQSATVLVLGRSDLELSARQLAANYVANQRQSAGGPPSQMDTVFIDHVTGSVFVVAGQIGLRQVYWAANSDCLVVASDPATVQSLSDLPHTFDEQQLFPYLYFHMVPSPGTVHKAVARLSGGHRLSWTCKGAVVDRYWRPTFSEVTALSEGDARTDLHKLLRAAVLRSTEGSKDFGAFLSGGLDSSTVAGMASDLMQGVPTISMGFAADGYDEMEYARIASRHFHTRPIEYYVTPDDVLETLPMIAAAFHEPFGNSSAAAAYHCARVAREHGIGRLLAGDGGDEIFGGNERYARQLVFERYSKIPLAIRKVLLEPFVDACGRITRAYPIDKAVSYIEQANIPLPDRLQTYNFLHRHDPADVFTPELLALLDPSAPLHALHEEYSIPRSGDPVNRMLFLDWRFTLHDNDLIKVNMMCDLAGVEVAYPMLDPSLVDFSLRLPSHWKVRNGQLRWFYKRAMRGFLPDAIIDKEKHGFGLPFGVWTRTHTGLQRLADDCLASMSERGFFRRQFLYEAQRLHRDGHASYYGELVWILMVLELWLQAHYPNARL